MTTAPSHALTLSLRSWIVLAAVSLSGLAMFAWPLFLRAPHGVAHGQDAPLVFLVMLPCLIAVVLAEMTAGRIDTKTLAMLGVLSAIGAVLRPIGAGTAGIETMLFLLVLAGRVYGPGFGFVLGATAMFTSALLTAGVGPWLPFQMLGAAWVGLGAGLLPWRAGRGRAEIALLAVYGVVSAYAFGFLLNLWFWPYTAGSGTKLSFIAGASVLTNLHRFLLFSVATSAIGWDTGRAVTNVIAIVAVGPTVLVTLRRSARRAAFGEVATFVDRPVEDVPVAS
ncbi:MAG TPA: ECF transporter S component [Acidimicrobiales bacterium]|nr:ECF transporter S component [Acidimicrobiales bacterium]